MKANVESYTGVIELNMPNTGPGEGGILLTANTGTIDIGVDYLGGNNIISTAYAGSGSHTYYSSYYVG